MRITIRVRDFLMQLVSYIREKRLSKVNAIRLIAFQSKRRKWLNL